MNTIINIEKDIKTLDKVLFSYRILSEAKNRGKLDFEVRTTLYPPVVSEDTIVGIGSLLSKNDKWILQQFRHSKNMLDPNCENIPPYTHEDINVLLSIAKVVFIFYGLRGWPWVERSEKLRKILL